jgi:putative two-component system response regulator
VKDRTAIISKIQRTTVFSLSKLAESRDTETGDHLERMRCYSRELAREMITLSKYKAKYTEEFAEEIFDSSPLHDIGKVGIPDRILLKPGKLSSDEFDVMKTHTTIGGDTLKAADIEAGTNSFLAMGRDIAFSHHEK